MCVELFRWNSTITGNGGFRDAKGGRTDKLSLGFII